jgi:hypothetical protein
MVAIRTGSEGSGAEKAPFGLAHAQGWLGAGGTVPGLLVIPEFLWELSLGIYCAIWGFRSDAPILSPERRA